MTSALFVFVFGAALRFWLNSVNKFSIADETVMCRLGLQASDRDYSYSRACERWFSEPTEWRYPGLLRFGNIFLLGWLFELTRSCSFRVLTTVSTVAGIASVPLAWLVAHRLSPGSENIAALLVATSPLSLQVSRRALQDAQSCAFALGIAASGLYGHPLAAGLLAAAMLAAKETTLTHIPPIGLLLWLYGVSLHSIALSAFCGAAVYLIFFISVGGSFRIFPKYLHAVKAAKADEYGRFQEGGALRIITDLFLLGPVVALAAARSSVTPALLSAALLIAIHAALPVLQSVRMIATGDALLRLVAGAVIARWSPMGAALFLGANTVLELALFRRVFIKFGAYDPVTINLVAALGMTPKLNTEALNG